MQHLAYTLVVYRINSFPCSQPLVLVICCIFLNGFVQLTTCDHRLCYLSSFWFAHMFFCLAKIQNTFYNQLQYNCFERRHHLQYLLSHGLLCCSLFLWFLFCGLRVMIGFCCWLRSCLGFGLGLVAAVFWLIS